MLKKVDKDKSSTKLIVRNVAIEATEKDLRQLFSPFGQVTIGHCHHIVKVYFYLENDLERLKGQR